MEFKQRFADYPTQALDELLSVETASRMIKEESGPHRERIYPPLTTLVLFIGQALSPDGACQDAVSRHLSERTAQGAAPCSLNSGPYCKARQRLPLPLIERLTKGVMFELIWKTQIPQALARTPRFACAQAMSLDMSCVLFQATGLTRIYLC